MPQQITQLLEILSAGGEVGVRFEVEDNGSAHFAATNAQGRAVLRFRPATLQLGAEGDAGGLVIRGQDGAPLFRLNGDTSECTLGTTERPSELVLTGNLTAVDASSRQTLTFDAAAAALNLGASGQSGVLTIKDGLNQDALSFRANGAELHIGNRSNNGELFVHDADGRLVFFFRSDFAELRVGENGKAGHVILVDTEGRDVLRVNGQDGTLTLGAGDNGGTLRIRDTNGSESFSFDTGGDTDDPFFPKRALARIGARESAGELLVRDDQERPTFSMRSDDATLLVGTGGKAGRVIVHDVNGEPAVVVTSEAGEPGLALPGTAPTPPTGTATVRIGGPRTAGELLVKDGHGRTALRFDSSDAAILRFGSREREGRLIIKNSRDREVFSFESDKALVHIGSDGQERILIDGSAGDILFKNADVAERFEVAADAEPSPGTVMALGDDGRLRPSSTPYDRRVVGVVAGAGAYRPGIVMDAALAAVNQAPISVFGKVSCKADATEAPIAIGDLLTSSVTPGHAMKAREPGQAFGAVIGKALTPLERGTGFVEMLVALQ